MSSIKDRSIRFGGGGRGSLGGFARNLVQAGVAVFANASVGVKVLCATVSLSYGLSYSETALRAFSVTPGYFWPPHFWLWTAFTYCFMEIHWWEVLVDVMTIVLVAGKLLEPLWGAIEMLTFFAVVNTGVAIVCAIFYYFLYAVTFNTELLFAVHIHGLAGYLAGVSVAVKQAMPDHVLYRSPLGKITNRNIPLLVFGLSFIMWAIGLVEGSYCTMFGSGLVISWIYLRFYQLHANGTRGDAADGFSFTSFFPNVLQPPLAVVGNTVFALLVRMRICKRPIRRYDVGIGGPAISISLPGVDNNAGAGPDTERRRQIALKALSDRLSKAESTSAGSASASVSGTSAWPTLDDDPPTGSSKSSDPSTVVPTSVHLSPSPIPSLSSDSKKDISIDIGDTSLSGGPSKN